MTLKAKHSDPHGCLSPAEKLSAERVKLVMEHIWRMQEFCNSMLKLAPDSYEYAYLKAIVLFSPGRETVGPVFTGMRCLSSLRVCLCACVCSVPDHPGIDNTPQIERFQEKAYMELQDYVTRTYPEDCYRSVDDGAAGKVSCTRLSSVSSFFRLSKLLVRLPALRLISATVTEELFFAGLIGNVQIDSIIPYILKMETTDYNSQTDSAV